MNTGDTTEGNTMIKIPRTRWYGYAGPFLPALLTPDVHHWMAWVVGLLR